MPTETESRIIAIIQEMKNSQDIDPNTVLIDSGLLDSFDVITLLMKLEEVFGVLIPGRNRAGQSGQCARYRASRRKAKSMTGAGQFFSPAPKLTLRRVSLNAAFAMQG